MIVDIKNTCYSNKNTKLALEQYNHLKSQQTIDIEDQER